MAVLTDAGAACARERERERHGGKGERMYRTYYGVIEKRHHEVSLALEDRSIRVCGRSASD